MFKLLKITTIALLTLLLARGFNLVEYNNAKLEHYHSQLVAVGHDLVKGAEKHLKDLLSDIRS